MLIFGRQRQPPTASIVDPIGTLFRLTRRVIMTALGLMIASVVAIVFACATMRSAPSLALELIIVAALGIAAQAFIIVVLSRAVWALIDNQP